MLIGGRDWRKERGFIMRVIGDFFFELIWIFGETGTSIIICVVLFIIGILIYQIVKRIKRLALYKPATCSVCRMPTGSKENKCFQLLDGCMCQSCAEKMMCNDQVVRKAGPKFFTKPPHHFSVAEVSALVAHYNEVGRDQILQERAAIMEQRRQEGVKCPVCGGTSVSATSDHRGEVWITCLNCGHQWRPGQHRSW